MSSELDKKHIIFELNDEYYGLPIKHVISIEKPSQTTRIPNAPDYVNGVINMRGDVIPVIDLRKKLGIGNSDQGEDTRIIVVSQEDIIAGLMVDSSSEVLEIGREDIDTPPIDENNQLIDFVNGIGKVKGKLIILLNLEKILEH